MSTYTPIATQTMTGTTTTVTFSYIPQDYTDLVCVISGAIQYTSTTSDEAYIRFGTGGVIDTGNNYSWLDLLGQGGSLSSNTSTSQPYIRTARMPAYSASIVNTGTTIVNVQDYTKTNKYKSTVAQTGQSQDYVTSILAGNWRNTSPIDAIQFYSGNGFKTGTTISLYGIQAGTPKAQGGQIVTTDGTYWYHAFTASGTFTPSSTITADYLVIAGGGGGGGAAATAAGGGAGGYRSATGQSLTTQAYSVIIGAGGVGGVNSSGKNGSDTTFNSLTSTGGGGGAGHTTNGTILQGNSGGSGGGSAQWNASGTQAGGIGNNPSTSPSQGNNGGVSTGYGVDRNGGGGGGAGAAGNGGSGNSGGTGGDGSNNFSTWATATNTGVSGYYAGGGGGGGDSVSQRAGGAGGGGTGYYNDLSAKNATINTGSGGGGINQAQGGSGASGLVIVRYAV